MLKPTIVYVDGFNLYYGLLRNTPWRWLDLGAFADRLAGRQREVRQIRYFTARIKPNPNDPHGMASQAAYLEALAGKEPRLSIEEGVYLLSTKTMPNANPPPPFVQVLKAEEKGTDVNIACGMLADAYEHKAETFILVSGDSDLATPVKCVRALGFEVLVFNPQTRDCKALQTVASSYTRIWRTLPRVCQLPNPCQTIHGRAVRKPPHW